MGAGNSWSEARWRGLECEMRRLVLRAATETAAWQVIAARAREVMRAYSTSFFVVTRFLPAGKRACVEAIYAAVRYPDEVVDTFPISAAEKIARLGEWGAKYELALAATSIRDAIECEVPCFLIGFAEVVKRAGIPPEHYRSFLEAMRLDIEPRPYLTLEDLIDSYIYGSAIVVGYFLTHVYGADSDAEFERALVSARNLGIALQLTNFLRDVAEDQRRGRLYLPLDILLAEGIRTPDAADARQHAALGRVVRRLARAAEQYYEQSLSDIDAFASDSRTAIRACVDVYRRLNDRIASSPRGILHRESVPAADKFRALPASKYWRLPFAYLSSR